MKNLHIHLLVAVLFFTGCNEQQAQEEFASKRISKTASYMVDENIDKVFPLYGAFEERKWAPGWEPELIYPNKEIMEEGTAFKTDLGKHGHGGEKEALWIVSKYHPEKYLVQYLVSTENRFWTITVSCNSLENDTKTQTAVTYTYTGLTAKGNQLNEKSLEQMFRKDLQDWKGLITSYFKTLK